MSHTAICPTCGSEGAGRCSLPKCGWKPAEILTSVTDDGEVMVTMPSGRVTFMGFWPAMKFVWLAVMRGYKVKTEE